MCLIHNFSGEDARGNTFCKPKACEVYSEFHLLFSEQAAFLQSEPKLFEGKSNALLRGWLFNQGLVELSFHYNYQKLNNRVFSGSFMDPGERTYYHFTLQLDHEIKGFDHLYFLKKKLVYCSGDVEMNPGPPYILEIEKIEKSYIAVHFTTPKVEGTLTFTSNNKARKKIGVLLKSYFVAFHIKPQQSFILIHHLYKMGRFNSKIFGDLVRKQVCPSYTCVTSLCRQKFIPVEIEELICYFLPVFKDQVEDFFRDPRNYG